MEAVRWVKENVDFRDVAEFVLGKPDLKGWDYLQWVCPFHKDHNPSFTAYFNGFYCFGCNAHGDVFDFVQQYYNVNGLYNAMTVLLAIISDIPYFTVGNSRVSRERHEAAPPDYDWRSAALDDLCRWSPLLSPHSPGGRYLLRRGIHPSVWREFWLGEADVVDPSLGVSRKAIVIPVFGDDGRWLWGMKYRFIDDVEGGLRYISRRGGKYYPYGAFRLKPDKSKTLLVMEGEFNVLSVVDCGIQTVDAVSFGSETPSPFILSVLREYVPEYGRVFVWADKPECANSIARSLGENIGTIVSEVRNGVKMDANALHMNDRELYNYLSLL